MAALIIVAGVLFALGATAVTPLSASTSNQHIQNQQLAMANDVLATTAADGSLRDAALNWTGNGFHGAPNGKYYTGGGPDNAFGNALDRTFLTERVAFNVHVLYWNGTSQIDRPITYMGSPSDNAVTASRTVTIYDDTELTAPGENEGETVTTGDFYADDNSDSELYNVLEVRITAWRM